MNKEQALHSFFSKFGIPAYDENTVPDEKELEKANISPYPRITYQVITDNFGVQNVISASIWGRSTSWEGVTGILHQMEETLGYGGYTVKYDDGLLWISRGMPFAQRMSDTDDSIRRIVMNLQVEFLSEV